MVNIETGEEMIRLDATASGSYAESLHSRNPSFKLDKYKSDNDD